jgi:PAS domain S-box-containing protein
MRDLALLWAAFFALALCIAAIVAAGIPARTPSRIGKLVSDAIDAPLTPIPATACGSSGEAESQEARVLKIVESMRGHAWSADAAGNFTYVSRNALTFLGHPRENLDHAKEEDEFGWRQFVHPDDYDRVAARWRHCLRTGEHYDTEHRLRRADGVYRWFRIAGKPSRNSQGRITGWYGTTMDIEDLKQAQATLHDRERELSQLVDLVPSHLWRLTPDGEPTFFNKRMVDFLGLDIAGTDKPGITRLEPVVETVHPDDVAAFEDALKHCLATGESFAMRYRLRRTDGIYRWMSSRAEPLRDPDGCIVQWYGLCHDIDDQVEVEEAPRRARRPRCGSRRPRRAGRSSPPRAGWSPRRAA